MIFLKLILSSVIALIPTFAYSGICQQFVTTEQCADIAEPQKNIKNCKTYKFDFSICFANSYGTRKKFYSCGECEDGYVLVDDPNFINLGCENSGAINVCQQCSTAKKCSDSTMPEETDWKVTWTGYQVKTHPECNTSTCKWETKKEYRCADNYYGPSAGITENYIEGFGVMGMKGCSLCPPGSNGSVPLDGLSEAGDNETIERCYLEGTKYNADFTGVFTLTSPDNRCYYN